MSQKVAFVTGITGQDGSWLAEFLVKKGYVVHGLVRQSTRFTPDKFDYLSKLIKEESLKIHFGDLNDPARLQNILELVQPDEVYNLAAQSHVGQSFEQPENTTLVTALGSLRLLDALHRSGMKSTKFYNASSSEMFGRVAESPQTENTRFHPRSPYGTAKVFGYYTVQNYREAYDMYAVSGIMFNHESARRGEDFVTRKITRAVGRIVAGTQSKLVLGNTTASRDWGYAPDYVEAMWMMMQQPKPIDLVIGTGVMHSVDDFVNAAFSSVNLDPNDFIERSPSLIRPSEVDTLRADPSLAEKQIGWKSKTSFEELVKIMVEHDVDLARKER